MKDMEDEMLEMKHLAASSSLVTGGVAPSGSKSIARDDDPDSFSSGTPQFIQIHCLITQHYETDEKQTTHEEERRADELDVKTKILTSVLFGDLLHTILLSNGYRDIDIFGAKGAIEFKGKWKPLSLEAVTDDISATVGEILGNLTAHLTLRIQLYRIKRFHELQEMKQSLLSFFLSRSEKVLKDSACPLNKEMIDDVLRGSSRVSAEAKAKFVGWCNKQSRSKMDFMNINEHGLMNINEHGFMNINEHGFMNINEPLTDNDHGLHSNGEMISRTLPVEKGSARSHDGETTAVPYDTTQVVAIVDRTQNGETLMSTHNPVEGASTCPENTPNGRKRFHPSSFLFDDDVDVSTEEGRLRRWFRANRRPSRDDMTRYLDKLNFVRSRQRRRSVALDKIVKWFEAEEERAFRRNGCDGIAAERTERLDLCGVLNVARRNRDDELSRKSPDDDDDDDDGSSLESVDKERVPYLPNRNAVYVIKPLRVDEEEQTSQVTEVIDAVSSDDDDGSSEDPECCPSSGSRDRRDSPSSGFRRHEKKSSRSDENHNRCDSPPPSVVNGFSSEHEAATDLSVRSKRPCDEPHRTDDVASTPANRLTRLWPIKKFEKDSKENDRHRLNSSPSPDLMGNVAIPPPFILHPHLHAFQQHQQHAFQMAMSLMHPAASAVYQNHHQPRPAFAMTTTTTTNQYDDDNQDSSGSVNGDSDRKKRSRVFIDPLTEIPRLERWFQDDSHPSSYAIEQYTDQLNQLAYRQRFPRLEPKNVQLWFKNHRAKVKRQRLETSRPDFLNESVYGQ